jgi:hypothetical protein
MAAAAVVMMVTAAAAMGDGLTCDCCDDYWCGCVGSGGVVMVM